MSYPPMKKSKIVVIGNEGVGKTSLVNKFKDTAGQERFRSLVPSYIRDSSVFIITFDVTCRKSFTSCFDTWIKEVRKESENNIWVVGNKTDLEKERVISFRELKNKSIEENVMCIETSAKNNFNVKKLFDIICKSLSSKGAYQEMLREQKVGERKDIDLKERVQYLFQNDLCEEDEEKKTCQIKISESFTDLFVYKFLK